ncbi:hypothetical protein IEU95_00690 [Hoyosella rhizosphaerae]|uniref:hypothetical protein n=1 Tax=Hoyosella rhizosphaerae TaxID=1755582 RepID=UPI0016693347|nr:hypothetical protein [Hoyosella rhizosphaerae]MBN4925337.1 hypothetical protein [Hoyosella rhizosphaerae]
MPTRTRTRRSRGESKPGIVGFCISGSIAVALAFGIGYIISGGQTEGRFLRLSRFRQSSWTTLSEWLVVATRKRSWN